MACDLVLLQPTFWLMLALALLASAIGGFAIGCLFTHMRYTERQLRRDARRTGN